MNCVTSTLAEIRHRKKHDRYSQVDQMLAASLPSPCSDGSHACCTTLSFCSDGSDAGCSIASLCLDGTTIYCIFLAYAQFYKCGVIWQHAHTHGSNLIIVSQMATPTTARYSCQHMEGSVDWDRDTSSTKHEMPVP